MTCGRETRDTNKAVRERVKWLPSPLQHPRQGLHEVLQVLPPLKSCSKSDFREKFANTYF
jgi:hypothetical protein